MGCVRFCRVAELAFGGVLEVGREKSPRNGANTPHPKSTCRKSTESLSQYPLGRDVRAFSPISALRNLAVATAPPIRLAQPGTAAETSASLETEGGTP